MEDTQRRASCTCGQLCLVTLGEPIRISMCHCHVCQRRTGSAFGAQLRFLRTQLLHLEGEATRYVRMQENENTATFHFCPRCGATLYYELLTTCPNASRFRSEPLLAHQSRGQQFQFTNPANTHGSQRLRASLSASISALSGAGRCARDLPRQQRSCHRSQWPTTHRGRRTALAKPSRPTTSSRLFLRWNQSR